MKAVVTGGAGFIGSNLVSHLSDAGHQIVVLDDLSSGYRKNLCADDIRFVEGDVRNEALVKRTIEGADAVFHLAASVGNKRSIDDPRADSEINVLGTINVLEAARAFGVPKVVFSSSAGVFGELKTLPIAEDHPCEPDSPYGASKLCAEKQCLAYAKLYGLSCVCLRYFNVYGPNQRYDAYGNVIPIFVFRLLRGQELLIYGDGEQTRDFINVRDIVQANVKGALARGRSGAFNLGSGTRVSINRLVEMIAEISGIRPTVLHGPPRPGDVRDSLASISKASAQFGFSPAVALEDGLREYIDWAKFEVAVQ